ncbi:unnamed protein product [Timema podura]|uniref:Peptidase S1 domain-containing protein n=1 Tax=Timema podura TaxID=61482 RepID=A0ABN7NM21_TIMPD|nr:unnamed protein product [Timema podura]
MAGLSAIEPKKVDQIIQSPRIFGGVRAKKGEYPFTVWIKSSINKCTGSILSQYWVLYAAHCAFKAPVESIIVIAGIIVYNPSSDDGQKRQVREIVFYPPYLGLGGYRYDMALLRVKEPFDMNQEVNTVAIAVSPFPRTAQLCTAIGFGKTEIYDETPTQKWVNLIVENPRICFTAHPEDDYHICGRGQTGKQPCIGDSGGPLICQDVLVGVTSFGVNKRGSTLDCDEPGNIIVFAFTGYYEDWIRSHVTDLRAPVKLSRSHHLKFELGYVILVISRGPGFQIFDEALGLERAQIIRQALYECIVSTFPHGVNNNGKYAEFNDQIWRKIQKLCLAATYKDQNSEQGKGLHYCFGLTYLRPEEEEEDAFCHLISIQPADTKLMSFTYYLHRNIIATFPAHIWLAQLGSGLGKGGTGAIQVRARWIGAIRARPINLLPPFNEQSFSDMQLIEGI